MQPRDGQQVRRAAAGIRFAQRARQSGPFARGHRLAQRLRVPRPACIAQRLRSAAIARSVRRVRFGRPDRSARCIRPIRAGPRIRFGRCGRPVPCVLPVRAVRRVCPVRRGRYGCRSRFIRCLLRQPEPPEPSDGDRVQGRAPGRFAPQHLPLREPHRPHASPPAHQLGIGRQRGGQIVETARQYEPFARAERERRVGMHHRPDLRFAPATRRGIAPRGDPPRAAALDRKREARPHVARQPLGRRLVQSPHAPAEEQQRRDGVDR